MCRRMQAVESGKKPEHAEKMVAGRMGKWMKEVCVRAYVRVCVRVRARLPACLRGMSLCVVLASGRKERERRGEREGEGERKDLDGGGFERMGFVCMGVRAW